MKQINFTIEGKPVAKGRPKAATRGKFIIMYTPDKTKLWEEMVALQAKVEYPEIVFPKGEVRAELTFYFKHAKSASKKQKQKFVHLIRPDVDNLAKSVLDALNGIFYTDDSQITTLYIKKTYTSPENEFEGVYIVLMGNNVDS